MRSSLEPHPQFGDRVICSIRKFLDAELFMHLQISHSTEA